MTDPLPTLASLRQAIDAVDNRIHDLLMERAELVLEVGKVKSGKPDAPYYRPEREAQIHRRLEERHQGPLPVAALHRIYREIISASLNLEKRLTIVYLGPEATFTHQASLKHFGSSFQMYPARAIDEVFHEVEVGRADFGVVPVENSTEGVVNHTLDCFVDSPLRISAEIMLPVVHNLWSRLDVVEKVRTVYGHFTALAQCRGWLDQHLPGVKVRECPSTARAAELACRDAKSGAIAGIYAMDSYGLNLLAEHVEDHGGVENRFLVVGRQPPPAPSGRDKTSLMFTLQDQPGFLYRVLGIFAERGLNLTRIESHPTRRKPWDHFFFMELIGHHVDPPVAAALADLAAIPGVFCKVLGSYPQRAL